MADRTSAEIFSDLIVEFNELYGFDAVAILYRHSWDYDFSEYQMSTDAQQILIDYGLWAPEEESIA